ncbi:MAG: hypothetical protein VXV96_04340 [Bdellovibrionota bacterium]|nr:hypothetical protein [Bdellovibrionota bacterium]
MSSFLLSFFLFLIPSFAMSPKEILDKGGYILWDGGRKIYEYTKEKDFTDDSLLGFKHRPFQKNTMIRRTESSIIYHFDFQTNEFGRRIDPRFHSRDKKFFYIAYGCSYIFGTGLENQDTLTSSLNSSLKETHAYNFATGGIGPNFMLADLRREDFKKEVTQTEGIFHYFYLGAHVLRANGFMEQLSWYSESPYFEKEGDILVRRGNFNTGRPVLTKLYNFLRTVLNWSRWGNFPKPMDSHYLYTCDLISESKKAFKKHFPKAKFVVSEHPLITYKMPPLLTECLKERGITLIRKTLENPPDNYFIHQDGHPTGDFNKWYASEIIKDLKLN